MCVRRISCRALQKWRHETSGEIERTKSASELLRLCIAWQLRFAAVLMVLIVPFGVIYGGVDCWYAKQFVHSGSFWMEFPLRQWGCVNAFFVSNFNWISFDDTITLAHFSYIFFILRYLFGVVSRILLIFINCNSFGRELLNALLMTLIASALI